MLATQRLQKIREIFIEKEMIDIPSLSEMLGVSEVTIRRDFEKLEKEGFIKKTYGGALLNRDFLAMQSAPALRREDFETSEDMRLISEIAQNMIASGDAIYLGGGTATRYIARYIDPLKRITVVTNDIFVAAELWDKPNVKTTVTGGELLSSTGILCGMRVIRTIREVFLTKAFIDVKGIDIKSGYSVDSFEESEILNEIVQNANESIAVADYKRFNSTSYARLGDIKMFQKVITNKEVDEQYKKFYFDNFIKLYTTYDVV